MSTETYTEYDVDGRVTQRWEIPGEPQPTIEATTTATVDVAALDAALARADTATTTAAKVNAVIAGLRAIRPDTGGT